MSHQDTTVEPLSEFSELRNGSQFQITETLHQTTLGQADDFREEDSRQQIIFSHPRLELYYQASAQQLQTLF